MMMRYLLFTLFIVFFVTASPIRADELPHGLILSSVRIDAHDLASIKRGAAFFATTCLSCHTLIYLKNDDIAQKAGITYDKMPVNVKSWPYNVTPPDLSLEASVRGVDWIYTYLHSFYQDTARPTGANNLLVKNTAMPNIVGPYQGNQIKLKEPIYNYFGYYHWFDALQQTKPGSVSADQFDAMIRDLVNFLDYAAEPFKVEQRRIGIWVLAFLVVLFILLYLLKREYWKDVKKHKAE